MKTLRLTLLVLAAAAVTGCMTTGPGYSYRGGEGDYYYGQPSVQYRYHGGYGGYGGYPYYGRSGWSFGLRYGYGGYPYGYYGGYPYGYPYYGYPYGYPYYRPPVVINPGGGHDDDHDDDSHDDRDPPWRDLDELRRRQEALERYRNTDRIEGEPSRPTVTVRRPPAPRNDNNDDGDSRMGSMMRRARVQQQDEEPRRRRIGTRQEQ